MTNLPMQHILAAYPQRVATLPRCDSALSCHDIKKRRLNSYWRVKHNVQRQQASYLKMQALLERVAAAS